MQTNVAGLLAALLTLSGSLAPVQVRSEPLPLAADSDECLRTAFVLMQKAEDRRLDSDTLDRIESLLSVMEDHCDSERFEDARQTGQTIAAVIDGE